MHDAAIHNKTMTSPPRKTAILYLVALLVVIVISRLPTVCNPYLSLTGDECVVGIMAKDIQAGQGLPVFMYGQHYGLASVEAGACAISFSLFGVSDASLRWAMLAIFLIGCGLLFGTLCRMTGPRIAYLCALVFILVPSWRYWSVSARSGYLTAFAFSNMALYWMLCLPRSRLWLHWIGIGVAAAIVYLGQGLFVLGLAPCVAWMIVRGRAPWKHGSVFIATVILSVHSISSLGQRLTGDYWGARSVALHRLPESIIQVPSRVLAHLGDTVIHQGTAQIVNAEQVDHLSGFLWGVLIVACGVALVTRLICHRPLRMSHIWCCAVLLVVSSTACLADYPRYLLPISGYAILWIGIEVDQWAKHRRAKVSLAFLCCVMLYAGAAGIIRDHYEFLSYDTRYKGANVAKSEYVDMLVENGIEHVYCLNQLQQYNILFYGDRRVHARERSAIGRFPSETRAVDRALREAKSVAILGDSPHQLQSIGIAQDDPRILVNKTLPHWWALRDPSRDLLVSAGFTLTK